MTTSMFIPSSQVSVVGSTTATTPPAWVSGAGTGSGNTTIIPDVTGAINRDLVLAGLPSRTTNPVTASPTGWTEGSPSPGNLRNFIRTIDNDIATDHTWTYQTSGITRDGVALTVRRGEITSQSSLINTVSIPDFTSPGPGSMLVVMAQQSSENNETLASGTLNRLERKLTKGSASYQTAQETTLFVEENLPAGTISGRQIDPDGGSPTSYRLLVSVIKPI